MSVCLTESFNAESDLGRACNSDTQTSMPEKYAGSVHNGVGGGVFITNE